MPPDARMNPVLLKPEGETIQVVLRGKVFGKLTPFAALPREIFWEAVEESFSSLCREYDLVLLEGMGSPAEINLREKDMANMALARRFDIPVLLVGDIERGGVFAALYGTWFLCKEDRVFLRRFVINKLRGEREILQEGVAELECLTDIPVVGILPYRSFTLDEEDGTLFAFQATSFSSEMLKIGVVVLHYMANLTDFRPLELEKNVYIRFVAPGENLDFFDLIILPGTKNK
ncbi:MAG: AAA family ATPase [Candidatus Caldatribacteriaceae bacterium]